MDDDATEYVISERDSILKRIEETRTAIHEARESGDWSEVPDDVYRKLLEKIELSTLPSVHGRSISGVMGIVSAEVLCRVNLHGDPTNAEEQLQQVSSETLEKLRARALRVNADAVVDVRTAHNLVDLDDDHHRFLIVSSGTAVSLN
jgi:uncharacterized protein YbjQ (UPF0145 family)